MNKQVNAVISMKDKFSAPLLKMSGNIKKLDKQTRDSMNSINRWGKQTEKSIDKAIKSSLKWAKRGAILLGGVSVKKGFDGISELDSAARKVKSIAGDALNLDKVKTDLLGLSGTLGKSVEALGDSWYNAISASVPMKDALDAVEYAHKLSIAGFTTDDSAMKLLASTMNTFEREGIQSMENISDIFLLTQNKGIILVDEMANLFGQVSPISKSLGVSLEEQAAAIALFTQKGLQPTKAITGYGRMLNRFMTKTGKDGLKTLKEMGLAADFFSAKTLKEKGFSKAMEEITTAAKGDMDKIAKLFPNINAKLAESMFAGKGMDKYKEIYSQMLNPEGTLEKAYETMENSIPRRWEKLKKKIESMNTKFYQRYDSQLSKYLAQAWDWLDENEDKIFESINKIGNIFSFFVEKMKELFHVIGENKEVVLGIVKTLVILYASFKIFKKVGKFIKRIDDIKNVLKGLKLGEIKLALPFGKILLIAGAIMLVIKAIKYMIQNWDKMQERFPTFTALVEKIGDVGKYIFSNLPTIIDFILSSLGFLKDLISPYVEMIFNMIMYTIEGVLKLIAGAVKTVVGVIQLVLGLLLGDTELTEKGFKNITSGIAEAWDGLKDIFFAPIKAVIDGIIDNFIENTEKAKEKWKKIREFFNNPIKATIEATSKLQTKSWQDINKKDPRTKVGANYKGTPNWKGGLTTIHERGGEIVDLPDGTRIFPHDRSVDMAYQKGQNDSPILAAGNNIDLGGIHFYGDVVADDRNIDRIGTEIANKIKDKLNNK